MSHFLIEESITAFAGSTTLDIRETAGGLLIETLNDQQGTRLLSIKKIGDINIELSPHTTLNTTKGVAVCRNLHSCTEDEITTELASEGVIACRSLTVRTKRQTDTTYRLPRLGL